MDDTAFRERLRTLKETQTEERAHACASRINFFWALKGYAANARVQYEHGDRGRGGVYNIVSDLVGGLPPGWRGVAAA